MLISLPLLVVIPWLAALPPEHQTAREKEAILRDPRLCELLDGEKISRIDKDQHGYILTTDLNNIIPIQVVYVPSGRIGPLTFILVFGEKKSCNVEAF